MSLKPVIKPLIAVVAAFGISLLAFVNSAGFQSSASGSANAPMAAAAQELEEAAFASEGAVFLARQNSTELIAIDIASSEIAAVIELPAAARGIVSTPGGVSVFVFFENSGKIQVYSAETFELQTVIQTSADSIGALSFSPNGDRVYIDSGDNLIEYRHSMLELSDPRSSELGSGQGAPILNRRGTRLYRGGERGISVLFAQTLQEIELIDTPVLYPVFEPGYSEIWGVKAEQNTLVAFSVDERTGNVRVHGTQGVSPGVPVVSNRISYLDENRSSLLQYVPRSANVQEIDLEHEIQHITRGPGQSVWAISSDGEIITVDNGRVSSVHRPENHGLLQEISLVATAVIRRDGSFACF
ncbi:YncE family protein [Spirochaeta dissipatitropha]